MSPIFMKSSKKLPNHPTYAYVKFESHRISFVGGSAPIQGFSLMRRAFYPLYTCISYLSVVQCCVIAQHLREGHVYMSLQYIYRVEKL